MSDQQQEQDHQDEQILDAIRSATRQRSTGKEALKGASALVGGTFFFIVLASKGGYISGPTLGYGLLVEAAAAAIIMLLLVTAIGLVAGLVAAKYLTWRYAHRHVLRDRGAGRD